MISGDPAKIGRTVLLGSSGRLGRLLRPAWPGGSPALWHSRDGADGRTAFDLLRDTAALEAALSDAGAVVCLSGITPAQAAGDGAAMSLNTDLALAVVRAAARAGAGRVFLASSAAVYGAAGGILDEDRPCAPLSPYGKAKHAMERAAVRLGHDLGHPVTALRIGNVAGADAILAGWRSGMEIDRFLDGSTPRRSYIGPITLARVLAMLARHSARHMPATLNIAAPGSVEMGAILSAADLPWTPRPAVAGAIPDVTLSTQRLAQLVPLAPEDSDPLNLVAEWRRVLNGPLNPREP